MIDELNMEHIGSIKSRYFPSIAVLYEGLINMPVRIYENLEHNLILVISDIPISHSISYDVSYALVDWAKSINVREFVSIAGIAVMDNGNKVFGEPPRRRCWRGSGVKLGFPRWEASQGFQVV